MNSKTFKTSRLVYGRGDKSWHSPETCVWAKDNIKLPNKLSIASTYAKQETFFTIILGVPVPTAEMHVRALIDITAKDPDKDRILLELKNICAFLPLSEHLYLKLRSCACFPVREPSGQIVWQSSKDEFAIADRKEYGVTFRDKLNILDLSLEEVHSVDSLLKKLDLKKRYMSLTVTEGTSALDGDSDGKLSRDLQRKSWAICR